MDNELYFIREQKKLEYLKYKEKLDEEEQKRLDEIKCVNIFITNLDFYIQEIEKAKNIIKVDLIISNILNSMCVNKNSIKKLNKQTEIFDKILIIITKINENTNIKFDVHSNNAYEKKAPKHVIKHIKEILSIIDIDENIISFDLMDTSHDEELVKNLQNEYLDELRLLKNGFS